MAFEVYPSARQKNNRKGVVLTLKHILLIVPISIIMVGCSSMGIMDMNERIIEDAVFMDEDILVQNDNIFGLTIIGFKDNYDIIYAPSGPLTLDKAGVKYPFRYIINGSYFEGSRVHAGWLSVFGDQHTPLKVDRQLTHMAILDTSLTYLDFPDLELWNENMTNEKAIEFQTGPLVIYNSGVDTLSIQASINGTGTHLRTLLATTREDGFTYFIITREPCRLNELGDYLLSMDVFSGKTLDVMNLDGGSSTALYSRNHPELNFNTRRALPLFLGIL